MEILWNRQRSVGDGPGGRRAARSGIAGVARYAVLLALLGGTVALDPAWNPVMGQPEQAAERGFPARLDEGDLLAGEDRPPLDLGEEDASWSEGSVPNKAIGCGGNASSAWCWGPYEELVEYEDHYPDGLVRIKPTAGVRDHVAATNHCDLNFGVYIMVPASQTRAGEMLDQMVVAAVTGRTIVLFWQAASATDSTCQLSFVRIHP